MDPGRIAADARALEFALAQGWLDGAAFARATTPEACAALLQELAARLPPAALAELQRASLTVSSSYGADAQVTLVTNAPGSDFPTSPDNTRVRPRDSLESLGPYRLLRELARGGMGAVYVARREDLDREVALKVLLTGSEASQREVDRFSAEARLSARLRHPNIVSVLDVGVAGRRHYLAMDLIQGESLKARLTRGALPPREAAELIRHLAGALAYAHRQAVLHRDLKPHNVLIEAETGRPLLTDFGLAKDTGAAEGLTKTGEVLGTPAYMSPEQAAGERDLVDRRSDVYGLGATLYEALTGSPPFGGDTLLNVISAVLMKNPVAPRRFSREIPPDLETIVLTCLRKEPLARYASAQALADDLGRFLAGEAIHARPTGTLGRAASWARRHRGVASAVGLVLLLASVGGVTGLVVSSRLEARAAKAEQARVAEETTTRLAATQAEQTRLGRAAAAEVARLEGTAALTSSGAAALSLRQGAFNAALRWQAIDPTSEAPYEVLRSSLSQLFQAAFALEEWQTARHAGEQLQLLARSLGESDPRRPALTAWVVAQRDQIESARRARFVERQAAIEAHLLAARPRLSDGSPSTLTAELVWIVQQRREETEAALFALSERFLAAALPVQVQRFAQAEPSARSIAARWLGGPLPASSTQLPPDDALALALQAPTLPDPGPLLQDALQRAFPDQDTGGLLEIVCLGIAHLAGANPRGLELLERLALATSGAGLVELPLRGLLVASQDGGMIPFQLAVLLSGGSRRISIDVLQGFTQVFRTDLDFQSLTRDEEGTRINRAAAHLQARRYGQGLVAVEGLTSSNARLMRGQCLLGLSLAEQAILELQHPDLAGSALAWGKQADAWLRLGCPRLALRDSWRAIALDPELDIAWRTRATAELDLADYPAALVSYERLLKLTPPAAGVSELGLKILRRQGSLDRAAKLAQAALARDPQDPGLLLEAARLLIERDDLAQAEQAVKAASQANARLSELYQVRARLRLAQGQLAQAGDDLRASLSWDPFLVEALEGQIKLAPGKLGPIEVLLARYPGSVSGRRLMAERLLAEQRSPAAIEHLSALLWLAPHETEARYLRIQAALNSDAVDLALADLAVLREEGRDRIEWHRHSAVALVKRGRAPEALTGLASARARWPQDPSLRLTEAAALAKVGRREEAARALDALLAEEPPPEIEQAARALRAELN